MCVKKCIIQVKKSKIYNEIIIYFKKGDTMNETQNQNSSLDKLLSLTDEELRKIFSQLSIGEINNLLEKLNEVTLND